MELNDILRIAVKGQASDIHLKAGLPPLFRVDGALVPLKDKDEVIGNATRVKVVKNKVAPPFKVVEFDIMYGEGVSKTGELIDLGEKAGVVEKSGSWYSYDGQRIGQGRENAKRYLKENPKVLLDLEAKVRSALGLKPAGGSPVPEKPGKA